MVAEMSNDASQQQQDGRRRASGAGEPIDEKVAALADIIRTYRGELQEEEELQEEYKWYEGPYFDIVMCSIILLNIFIIGLDTDFSGRKIGYDRDAIWIFLEWLFCLVFMGEVYIKVKYLTWSWFREDPWSWLSLFVATMAFIDIAILSPLKVGGLRILSLVRVINLLRLYKLIAKSKMLKELKLVMRGVVGSGVSLCWAMAVLLLILYTFSVWTTTLIGFPVSYRDHMILSHGWDNEKLFGTLGRSMFTLIQVMSTDTWCSGIARHVSQHQWYMIFLFGAFMMITTYGILNLIICILVEQTLEATHQNDTKQKAREERDRSTELECLHELFELADLDGGGTLNIHEFNEAYEKDAEVRWRLRQYELPVEDARGLFSVSSTSGTRVLNIDEFVEGCTKLHGPARSKDLLALTHQADHMSSVMDRLATQLRDSELMLARLDDCTKRLTTKFGPNVVHSRRVVEERVRGAAPIKPTPKEKVGDIAVGHLAASNVPILPNLPPLV